MDEALDRYSAALLAAADGAVAGWVVRAVEQRAAECGVGIDRDLRARAVAAGEDARAATTAALRALFTTDVDEQRTNPLAVLRSAAAYPTAVLRAAGVPPVPRDPFAERTFPDDVYGLAPATWRDVDESLQEPGIAWGAWKAMTVLERRRAEGRR